MSKQAIIKRISKKLDLEPEQVSRIVSMFASGIVSDCIKGESVILRGFGTFEMVYHKSRIVTTNGKTFTVPGRRVIKFRPGKMLHIDMKSPVE
jgi:nucleoid DNA-binding protein